MNLSQLIQEAWENVVNISYGTDLKGRHYVDLQDLRPVFDYILTNIVKESFKNTRVEEKSPEPYNDMPFDWGGDGNDEANYKKGWNECLSHKHNKENQFLNN